MTTIVTRAGKGSPLTHTEADANFTNLNTDKIQVSTITGATSKATLVDADVLPLVDSVGGLLNKGTWANIKTTLASTFAAVAGSVSQVFSASSIELGHATDTTLTRVSAGVVAVEGSNILLASGLGSITQAYDAATTKNAATQTLTNKRVTPRVGSTTSHATPTINTDNVDIYKITAQTEAITSMTTNLSGTPTDGQVLIIQITGTAARAITWGASFEASTVALPTTTVTTAMLSVGFLWNTATSKWRCMAAV